MLQAYNIHLSNPKIEYEHSFTEIDFICYIIQLSIEHRASSCWRCSRICTCISESSSCTIVLERGRIPVSSRTDRAGPSACNYHAASVALEPPSGKHVFVSELCYQGHLVESSSLWTTREHKKCQLLIIIPRDIKEHKLTLGENLQRVINSNLLPRQTAKAISSPNWVDKFMTEFRGMLILAGAANMPNKRIRPGSEQNVPLVLCWRVTPTRGNALDNSGWSRATRTKWVFWWTTHFSAL